METLSSYPDCIRDKPTLIYLCGPHAHRVNRRTADNLEKGKTKGGCLVRLVCLIYLVCLVFLRNNAIDPLNSMIFP